MRTVLAILLMLGALPALAAHAPVYAPARDSRGLAHEARHLDDAASAIFRDLYSRRGRSQLTHEARELAEATRGFRRQLERGAAHARLHESYRRVGHRYATLERRAANQHSRDWNRHGPRIHGLQAFARQYRDVGESLHRLGRYERGRRHADRYAWDRRDGDSRRDRHRHDD
jgi:hypothetical protein